jgi:hypothetical protein
MKGEGVTIDEALSRPTISVPDAGKLFFGLARNAAYEAAKRGDIPTVKIGGKKMAVVTAIARQLGLETTIGRAA